MLDQLHMGFQLQVVLRAFLAPLTVGRSGLSPSDGSHRVVVPSKWHQSSTLSLHHYWLSSADGRGFSFYPLLLW